MLVYHTTPSAVEILMGGFRDGCGTDSTSNVYQGVWLADHPLDANDGAEGDTVLRMNISEDVVLEWERVEDGKSYREFLVPAEVVNRYCSPTVFAKDINWDQDWWKADSGKAGNHPGNQPISMHEP